MGNRPPETEKVIARERRRMDTCSHPISFPWKFFVFTAALADLEMCAACFSQDATEYMLGNHCS